MPLQANHTPAPKISIYLRILEITVLHAKVNGLLLEGTYCMLFQANHTPRARISIYLSILGFHFISSLKYLADPSRLYAAIKLHQSALSSAAPKLLLQRLRPDRLSLRERAECQWERKDGGGEYQAYYSISYIPPYP